MSKVQDGKIVFLHDEQIKKINDYIRLTNSTPPAPDVSFQEFHDATLNYIRIIEAFDNDPIKAASCWNKAIEKADNKMGEVYDKMLAHIPKPTKEHFYSYFNSSEEAEAYKEKISQRARAVFSDTMTKEFYNVLETRQSMSEKASSH